MWRSERLFGTKNYILVFSVGGKYFVIHFSSMFHFFTPWKSGKIFQGVQKWYIRLKWVNGGLVLFRCDFVGCQLEFSSNFFKLVMQGKKYENLSRRKQSRRTLSESMFREMLKTGGIPFFERDDFRQEWEEMKLETAMSLPITS